MVIETAVVSFDGLENNETLTKGTDYEITSAIFDNANVGTEKTVTVKVALIASETTSKNYVITGADADGNATYTGSKASILPLAATAPTKVTETPVYNGKAQSGVTGYTGNEAGFTKTSGTVSGTDAGEYSATFTLNTGYVWSDGTAEPKVIGWSIAPKEITDDDVAIEYSSCVYSGTEKEPGVTVKAVLVSGEDVVTLEKGKDYTVDYADNKEFSTADKPAKVTGTGNYKGMVTKTFTIVDKAVQTLTFAEQTMNVTYGDTVKGQTAVNDKTDGGAVTYSVDDEAVAKVDASTGALVVKGVKKGKTFIYVFTQNGICKKVTVTVK